jgi:hypothetical protein
MSKNQGEAPFLLSAWLKGVALSLLSIFAVALIHSMVAELAKKLGWDQFLVYLMGPPVGTFLSYLVGQTWFWMLAGLSIGLLLGIWVARRVLRAARKESVTPGAERAENHRFGIEITNPRSGQTIVRRIKVDVLEVEGTYKIQPGRDVFAFVFHNGNWWPQPHRLSGDGSENRWRTKVHLGGDGNLMLYIVRADELGIALIEYFRKVVKELGHSPGIEMTGLPEGLYEEAKVDVVVVPDSALMS